MRVIFITHYATLYGANRSLLNLMDGLRLHGVQSAVLVPEEGEISAALISRGIQYYVVPIRWWVNLGYGGEPPSGFVNAGRRLARNVRSLPYTMKRMREFNPDVIYSNSSATPFGALLAWAMGKPHVWHVREYLDLHYGFKFDFGKKVYRWGLSSADARIAVSNALLRDRLADCDPKSTHVVYNGIAWAREIDGYRAQVEAQEQRSCTPTFAIVGLVHEAKGQEEAIRAVRLMVDRDQPIRLLIVGGGNVDRPRKLARALGVESHVEFWGYVEDPFKAYLACDALLMCSRNEAMGRVTVEAMAACRPVIGFDSGGTSELVRDGENGLLYRGNVEELASCMWRMIAHPDMMTRMGFAGWKRVRDQFTIEVYAQSVYDILRSVLAASERRAKLSGCFPSSSLPEEPNNR